VHSHLCYGQQEALLRLLDITTEAYFTDEVEECICQILDAQATPKADAPDIETSFVQTSQQRLNLPRLRYSLMYQQKYTGLFLFYS